MQDKTITLFHDNTATIFQNCTICPAWAVSKTEHGQDSANSTLLCIPVVGLDITAGKDFFMIGEYSGEVHADLYNELKKQRAKVYLITSATEYSVIPHIEIIGK